MSGLANEDFRKLVAESKPAKPQKPKKKTVDPEKAKAWKKKQQDDEEDGPKYRDRAEERRRGLNPDYQDMQRDFQKLSADQTKFLGGDMDRAHLVKGLDYALLHKVRKDEMAKGGEADAAAQPAHPKAFATAVGRGVYDALFRPPASNVAEMFKPRRMAFVFFDEDAELPDGEDPAESSMPYTLVRSKADCPEPPECMNAVVDAAVLNEVVGIMRSVKIEAKSRGKKKGKDADLEQAQQEKERHIMNLRRIENPRLAAQEEAQRPLPGGGAPGQGAAPPPPAARPAVEVDNIFDDVGDDYEVDPGPFRQPGTAPSEQGAANNNNASYFGHADDMKDLPAVAQHGTSVGNECDAPSQPNHHAVAAAADGAYAPHGYDASGYHAGYHHAGYGQQGYQNGYGYDGAQQGYYGNSTAGAGGYGGAGGFGAPMAPPPPRVAAAAPAGGAKGRGFEAKMGDRAFVRQKFSKDQRRMEDGVATLDVAGDDIYGVDVLLGAGGMEEEEEDLRDMEKKGHALNRADFQTDEQFNSYKASREAAPKAAFQFGVKVADGRRTHKDMDRRMANKLESQLGKIQKVFKEKGYESKGAFSKPEADAAATPARKRVRLGV